MTTLLPDHVEKPYFEEEDNEYEYEYETNYVTLDLGNIDQNILLNSNSFRLIGLDSPTPYIQLGGLTLKGTHESLIGSELIFAEGRDPQNRSRRFVTHIGTTSKRIQFRPVQLTRRESETHKETDSTDPPPVLFQGPRKKAKTLPLSLKRAVGRPRKERSAVPTETEKPMKRRRTSKKGKAKEEETEELATAMDLFTVDPHEDHASDSGSGGEVDYGSLDPGPPTEVPEGSTRRRSLRARVPKRPDPNNAAELLEALEVMDEGELAEMDAKNLNDWEDDDN